MAKRLRRARTTRRPVIAPAPAEERTSVASQVLEPAGGTVLDLVDHLLNKGVMANGDLTLGVAGIDLVYLRLAALLCAADRVLPHDDETEPRPRSRLRRPRGRRRR